LPILPDCNRQSSAVPLWKVIVGPAPTNSANRTREGPVFFLCRFLSGPSRTFDATVFFCAVADCGLACAPKPIYVMRVQNKLGKNTMAWTTPTLVEICIGLEINGYLPAEF
jgi:coenzyme PQQ precursor peptide PqqA